jgi:hypothetical protein
MTSLPNALAYQIVERCLAPDSPRDFAAEYRETFVRDRAAFDQRIAAAVKPLGIATEPSHGLPDYAGAYTDAMYGTAEVALEDGRLVLKLLPNTDLVADLSHLYYDTFRVDWRKEIAWFGSGALQFKLDLKGHVAGFVMDIPNDDLWFHELDFKKNEPR